MRLSVLIAAAWLAQGPAPVPAPAAASAPITPTAGPSGPQLEAALYKDILDRQARAYESRLQAQKEGLEQVLGVVATTEDHFQTTLTIIWIVLAVFTFFGTVLATFGGWILKTYWDKTRETTKTFKVLREKLLKAEQEIQALGKRVAETNQAHHEKYDQQQQDHGNLRQQAQQLGTLLRDVEKRLKETGEKTNIANSTYLLIHGSPDEQWTVVQDLVKIQSNNVIPPLMICVRDPHKSDKTKALALNGLALLANYVVSVPDWIKAVAVCTRSENRIVRQEAIKALGALLHLDPTERHCLDYLEDRGNSELDPELGALIRTILDEARDTAARASR